MAARKTTTPNPNTLSEAQIERLKKEAAEHREAVAEFCEAAGVLWNARLDMAIASKGGKLFERTLRIPPLKLWDDCSCGCDPIIVACW
jgi:hypothetical protein